MRMKMVMTWVLFTSIDNGEPSGGLSDGRPLHEELRERVVEVAEVDGAHARDGGVRVGPLDDGIAAGGSSGGGSG